MGLNSVDSDSINRQEAEDIIKKNAASDSSEDLAFASELAFEERKELATVAKKYGLNYRKVVENKANGRKRTYLVITKKIGPEFIIEQLEREGSWGRYSLVNPKGGDR